MCSSPKGKSTNSSQTRRPVGSASMTGAQHASFARISNAAYERRQAKKSRMQSEKDTYLDTMATQDGHLRARPQAHSGIQESIFMRLARWLLNQIHSIALRT